MILDLNPLPYRLAFDIIKWCWENNIDSGKCYLLNEMMASPAGSWQQKNIDWTLDIPDKYVTFFLLKWSNRFSDYEIK